MGKVISDERMDQLIRRAKSAATIVDNESGGMGLTPRAPRFSDETYKTTLAMLIEIEMKGLERSGT